MADESVDSMVKIEQSINTSKRDSYSLTGNSTPKSDSGIIKRDKIPHYLRASTGSCHDLCKFGHKHSSEEKARKKDLRKRITTKSLQDKVFVEIIVAGGENKKETIANRKPKTIARSCSLDSNPSPNIKSCSSKPKTSSDNKKVVKTQPLPDTKIHSPDKKTTLTKTKVSPGAKTVSSDQNASSGNKSIFKESKPLFTKKRLSLDRPDFVKSVCFPCKNDDDPVKNICSADSITIEKKPVKLKPVKVKPTLSSSGNLDLICGNGSKNTNISNVGQNTTPFKRKSAKKVSAHPAATLYSKLPVTKRTCRNSRKAENAKLVSRSKERNITIKVSNEKGTEKILHVVESTTSDEPILPLSPPLAPTPPSHENSSFLSFHEENQEERELSNGEAEGFTPKKKESREICKVPPPTVIVKENHSKTLRRLKLSVSEDYKTRSPVKLKFRNVKVVVAQSNINKKKNININNDNNNTVPNKLRFRTGRVIGGDEGKSDLRRKLFKKASASDRNTREEVSSEKVVLKHRDVQGTKGHRGLLNNVIEQTASKLVESKKSKVKALVGAFETVISLQESKPSSQTTMA